jgi:hypothetical protein
MNNDIDLKDILKIKEEINLIYRIQDIETQKKQLEIALIDMIKKGYKNVTLIAYSLLSENKDLAYIVRVVAIRIRVAESIYNFDYIDNNLSTLYKNIEKLYVIDFIKENEKDGVSVKELDFIWLTISKKKSPKTFLLIEQKIKEMRQLRKGIFCA